MGKKSIKPNKNMYQIYREDLELTRAQASELLDTISADRLEKIESGKTQPYPEEILRMSECYKRPELCNRYCSHECAIGRQYVPEIEMKSLSQITLEMLSSLNSLQKQKDRFIDIAADGKIEESEIADFVFIQNELEKISVGVESLQLWLEKTIADQGINENALKEARKKSLK